MKWSAALITCVTASTWYNLAVVGSQALYFDLVVRQQHATQHVCRGAGRRLNKPTSLGQSRLGFALQFLLIARGGNAEVALGLAISERSASFRDRWLAVVGRY
jgi:hypothetical protein